MSDTQRHVEGQWCVNLHCMRCYAAETWQKAEIEKLRAELEQTRVQLAGCGVAAMQNTPESRKDRAKPGDYGYSASYADVCRAVDREIALRVRRNNG